MKTPMGMTGFVVLGFVLMASTVKAQPADFKLVVNESNRMSSLTPAEATQFFLKKKTTWPDGGVVAPVDQVESSPVRRAFSKAVLRKDVEAVKGYWQTQIFSGRAVPAPEKASDVAVLAFVDATPGAIGYVSAGAPIRRGVKEIKIR